MLTQGTNVYTWDAANRLIEANVDGVVSNFKYNGLGQRTEQTVGGVTTQYMLDVAGGLPEAIVATTGRASIRYVQIQGQILAQYDSGTWTYVAPDALGSVRQLADADGHVTLAQHYDPFGNLLETAGQGASEFGYTGEWWDSYMYLLFLRARYYDPFSGRFIGKDPLPGFAQRPRTLHSYVYVTNNPTNGTDPSGYQVGEQVLQCPLSNPACQAAVAEAVAIAAVTIEFAGLLAVIVGPPAILMALSAKYGVWVEPVILPEPVPEAQDYYQPYPGTRTQTDVLDEWADVANNAWDNWQPEPERRPDPRPARKSGPLGDPIIPPVTCTPERSDKFYYAQRHFDPRNYTSAGYTTL